MVSSSTASTCLSHTQTPDEQTYASLLAWFRTHRRDLPWRREGTTAWGVLLSEVMSQQTPVNRVIPQWHAWLDRWPTPRELAHATPAEVLRLWGNLGYPRRALRLHDCARVLIDAHQGCVPDTLADLLALPGIGDYTARAILAFHFRRRVPVVDTNVRRVYHRAWGGTFLQGSPRAGDLRDVERLLPLSDELAAEVSTALMELGALVCTARQPACLECPLCSMCRWYLAGQPEPTKEERSAARRRVQKYVGTDRQVRGKIMAALRTADHVSTQEIIALWPAKDQRDRALASLLADGLAVEYAPGMYALPTEC